MTPRRRFRTPLAAALFVSLPAIALAHPGHEAGANFASGILHPLSGFDHLLALLAVGVLAGRMGGLAGVGTAVMFTCLTALGISAGYLGIAIPFDEFLIGLSVVASIALALRPPRHLPVATALLAGAFAIVHGTVHGQEAAAGIERLPYAVGLVTSSALMLSVGAMLALAYEGRGARASR